MSKRVITILGVLLALTLLGMAIPACSSPAPAQPTAAPGAAPAQSGQAPAAKTGEVITIKYNHSGSEEYFKHWFGLKLGELIEKELPGRVKVEIYPRGQLFSDKDAPSAALRNSVQLVDVAYTELVSWDPGFDIFALPGAFTSQEQVLKWYYSDKGGWALGKRIEPKGLKVVTWLLLGPSTLFTTKSKVPNGVADLKGLKLRGSSALDAKVNGALGATGVSLSIGEVFTALQQGMIDGLSSVEDTVIDYGLADGLGYEVSNWVRSTGAHPVFTSVAFWDGLPADVRAALQKVIPQATEYTNNRQLEKLKTVRQTLIGKGMKMIDWPQSELDKVDTMLKPLVDEYTQKIGQDIIDEARRLK